MFVLPLFISLFQVILLACVFPYDTPVIMKQKGNLEDLKTLMNKIYKTEEIAQERIDVIVIVENEDGEGVSYG